MTQSSGKPKEPKKDSYSEASRLVAERVRARRRELRWTQDRLAEELREIGLLHFDRQIIANLEYNRRKFVSLDEVLGIAYVMRLPPVLLFLPIGQADEVEPVRGMRAHPARVLSWVTGDAPAPAADGSSIDVAQWREASLPLRLYRDLSRQEEEVSSARSGIRAAEFVGKADEISQARQRYADALRDLCDLLRPFEAAKLLPPALPAEWIETARSFGYAVPQNIKTMEESNG